MASDAPSLSAADQALIERVATRVVELHMSVPAILTLETAKPLSVIASQALIFFEPMIQSLFRFTDYQRVTALLERRDAIEALILRIEAGEDAARLKRAARGKG
jgi:hypothetical protein